MYISQIIIVKPPPCGAAALMLIVNCLSHSASQKIAARLILSNELCNHRHLGFKDYAQIFNVLKKSSVVCNHKLFPLELQMVILYLLVSS